jgi:hypothetical protein
MPGRHGGVWPQAPSGRDARADVDVGVDGFGESDRSTGASDLGVDGSNGADVGVAARDPELWAQTAAPRRSDPGSQGRPRPKAPKTEARTPQFGRGQRVRHVDYGTGTVIASSVVGSEELALVRFDSRPDKPKNLSLSIHRLDPA